MHPRRGTAAVRLAAWALLAASLALALVQPAQAGTADAPEIQDPANDQSVAGTVPVSQQPPAGTTVGLSVDLVSGFVSEPDAANYLFTVRVQGTGGASSTSEQEWRFFFTIAGTAYTASAHVGIANVDATYTVGGVATAVAAEGDGFIALTVPKSAVGNPAPGAVVTGMYIESESILGGQVPDYITDRAPDDGAGLDYTTTGGGSGAGGNVTAGDTDGDGLNDTCETKYFGSLNATSNASADPDGDGLTNGQECALGTDPTNPDSDGDGVDDKNDVAPTDPTKGGNATSSSSSSTSRSGTTTSRSSTSSAASGGSKGSVTDLAGAIDKLQSDVGYLGMSAGGFLAVLVLCIIGLAVRWSL